MYTKRFHNIESYTGKFNINIGIMVPRKFSYKRILVDPLNPLFPSSVFRYSHS